VASRINMTDRTYSSKLSPPPTRTWVVVGFFKPRRRRGPAAGHPLGPNNKLVFAPGIVSGTSAPTSARVSVGGKSPLTGASRKRTPAPPGRRSGRLADQGACVEGQPKEKGKWWGYTSSWDATAGKPKVEFLTQPSTPARTSTKYSPRSTRALAPRYRSPALRGRRVWVRQRRHCVQ